ncbi:MAG: DNA repair protein RadC [Cyanobacteria bacterium J06636_16]
MNHVTPSTAMTYTTLKPPTELWMCKDSTKPETKVGIDEYVPLAAIAELIATICSIPVEKAEACVDAVCGQSDLLQTEAVWSRLRVVSAFELQRTGGLTPKQAAKLKAAIELGRRAYAVNPDLPAAVTAPTDAYHLLADQLAYQSVERFAAIALDIKHRPLAIKVLTQGSSTGTLAPPRDIFRWALAVGAARLIVAHNHPSGNLDPSKEDLALTEGLIQAGKQLDIPVLDHVVIGKGSFTSIRQTCSHYWN